MNEMDSRPTESTGKDTRDDAPQEARMLEALLHRRHSCRAFQPAPLPRATIERLLSMAQRSASWCNTQPWHVHIVSGARLETFRRLYTEKVMAGERRPDLRFPIAYRGRYQDRRKACGLALYDSVGIGRDDKERANEQLLQNYRFFGAPHVAVVTTERDLGDYGAIDCGGYIGLFLLAADSLGVAAIPQAAIASNSAFVREFLAVPEGRLVVAGIAFGLADAAHPVNGFRTRRAPIDDAVTWVDDPDRTP